MRLFGRYPYPLFVILSVLFLLVSVAHGLVTPSRTVKPQIDDWYPVEFAHIPSPDPRYHPDLPPVQPTPTHSVIPSKDKGLRDWLANAKLDKWAVCIAEYGGHLVPARCPGDTHGGGFYRKRDTTDDFILHDTGFVCEFCDTDNASKKVKEYLNEVAKDPEATCRASFNSWEVPSRCDRPHYEPKHYTDRPVPGMDRLDLLPPASETAKPVPHHYHGDPDENKPNNPFYPSPEQKAQYFKEGEAKCFPRDPAPRKHHDVPYEATARALLEHCAAERRDVQRDDNDQTVYHATDVFGRLFNNLGWYTYAVSNGQDMVQVSFRQSFGVLGEHSSDEVYPVSETECQQRFNSVVKHCISPGEYGSGLAVVNGNAIYEVESRLLDEGERPREIKRVSPWHPM